MTLQEIFNKAFAGLRAQGFKKAGDDYSCYYRLPHEGATLKCAIGHVIPDGRYDVGLEGVAADGYRILDAMGLGLSNPAMFNTGLLRSLQRCHDMADGPEHMELRLRTFAAENGLTVPDAVEPPSAG